ncbi:MAG: hypothetical protein R2883_01115 [Caldisericia bacterium]
MKTFSNKFGFIEEKDIQRNGLDEVTRNMLWNVLYKYLEKIYPKDSYGRLYNLLPYMEFIYHNHFKIPIDRLLNNSYNDWIYSLRQEILTIPSPQEVKSKRISPFKPFDLIEISILYFLENDENTSELIDNVYDVLEQNKSVYRISRNSKIFYPVIEPLDIENLETAL